jgi:hypothetical protein
MRLMGASRYAVNVASVCVRAFERVWLLRHTPVALHREVGDRHAPALRDEFLNGLHFIGSDADEFAYGVCDVWRVACGVNM